MVFFVQGLYDDKLFFKIDVDNPNTFVANMDTDKYLSQLTVSEPEWRPYNYVELSIMDISKDVSEQPVFWYGDRIGDTAQEIINNLNKGLNILFSIRTKRS